MQRLSQIGPQVAIARRFATVDVLGDATREGQRRRPMAVQDQRLGQQKGSAHLGRLLATDIVDQDVGQSSGQAAAVVCRQPRAQAQRNAELLGDQPGGRLNARDALVAVEGDQASADVHGSGRQHFAVVQQAEFGGAAADVDVQQGVAALVRQSHRARAVRGENALEIVAGGGAHELAARAGEQLGHGAGVGTLEGCAGENDCTSVDVFGG